MKRAGRLELNNPLHGNPLKTRNDLAAGLRALIAPALKCLEGHPGRLALGSTACRWETYSSEFEGFARLFWGLAPFAAGGFSYPEAEEAMRAGLAAGTDPDGPYYWGEPGVDQRGGKDQRLCDMAPIGFALAIAPETYWEPLSDKTKANLVTWLKLSLDRPHNDNNWLYFRVLVASGLRRIGASFDWAPVETHLERLESFATGPGWYEDGSTGRYDHYIAWAMHFYGLIYAKLSAGRDQERAGRLIERATTFAPDYAAWFADDGGGLPYGRSLIYRCAQSAYWGALAFADCEAMPWGVVKGLALRNIRYWSQFPIAQRDGILSLGYTYENPNIIEEYSADGSPYWALKAFLPLALPAEHPFWTEAEVDHPLPPTAVSIQPDPKMVLYRHEGETIALTGGQTVANSSPDIPIFRNAAAKYAKFAYSSRHGFSVELDARHAVHGCFDNMLALRSENCVAWRVREANHSVQVGASGIVAVWRPWPEVEIETILIARPPWHIRVHIIRTPFALRTLEGGFSIDREGDSIFRPQDRSVLTQNAASAIFINDCGSIVDLLGQRTPRLIYATANGNLCCNRTAIPSLEHVIPAGTTALACAVVTARRAEDHGRLLANVPTLPPDIAARLAALKDG